MHGNGFGQSYTALTSSVHTDRHTHTHTAASVQPDATTAQSASTSSAYTQADTHTLSHTQNTCEKGFVCFKGALFFCVFYVSQTHTPFSRMPCLATADGGVNCENSQTEIQSLSGQPRQLPLPCLIRLHRNTIPTQDFIYLMLPYLNEKRDG